MPAKKHNPLSAPVHLTKSELRHLADMPLPDLFTEIYRKHFWGEAITGWGEQYFSGSGSHESSVVNAYIESVKSFFIGLDAKPVVVDLGCGDFNIGSQLSQWARFYHACDIVPGLIETLRDEYHLDNIEFHCMDATCDPLPAGDVLIVRQVLQHLSNQAIKQVVCQFQNYRYVLVTEHLPKGAFSANKDKPNGPDSRLRWCSGVDLLQQPFDLALKKAELLCETEDPGWPSTVIKTVLYQMN